jgi:hypothetical protein
MSHWPHGAPGPVSVMPVPDARDPLTISDVARLIDVEPGVVTRAIARGELRAYTRPEGPRRWVWRRDVAIWLSLRVPDRKRVNGHRRKVGA